jgi:hypothetical protein
MQRNKTQCYTNQGYTREHLKDKDIGSQGQRPWIDQIRTIDDSIRGLRMVIDKSFYRRIGKDYVPRTDVTFARK